MKQEYFEVFERCLNRMDEKVNRVFDYSEKHHYTVDVSNNIPILYKRVGATGTKVFLSKEEVEINTGIPYDSLLYVLSLSQSIAHDAVTRSDPMKRKDNIKEKLPVVLLASAIIATQLKINYQKGKTDQNIDIDYVTEKLFEIFYQYNTAMNKAMGKKPIILTNETQKFLKELMKESAFFVDLNHELGKENLTLNDYKINKGTYNSALELKVSSMKQKNIKK